MNFIKELAIFIAQLLISLLIIYIIRWDINEYNVIWAMIGLIIFYILDIKAELWTNYNKR